MDRKLIMIAGGVGFVGLVGGLIYHFATDNSGVYKEEFLRKLGELLNPKGQGLANSNAFDVKYLDKARATTNRRIIKLKDSVALKEAKKIKKIFDEKGFWDSSSYLSSKVMGVLGKLQDQVQVSQVAKTFLDEYSFNLIDTIKSNLDSKDIESIIAFTKSLPKTTTK